MSASEILTIDVACPRCGAANSLTLGDVEARRKVNCSACGAPLGTGQDLSKGPSAPRVKGNALSQAQSKA